MGIVVIGDVFIDVKGYSTAPFIPGEETPASSRSTAVKKCSGRYCQYRIETNLCQSGR